MNGKRPYRDRPEAGEILATHLREQPGLADAIVLALPRGGVPVGLEVALALETSLDVAMVRKLGVPFQRELAMGAIAADGSEVLNRSLIAELGISPLEVAAAADRAIGELRKQEVRFGANRPPPDMRGRTVVVVDDGLATGFTMRAALGVIRQRNPGRLVVAVPVGDVETCDEIARIADLLICPLQPEPLEAVGLWYEDFAPVTDDEVRAGLLTANSTVGHAFHLGSTSR